MQDIKYMAVKYIRLSSADDNKNGESDSVANQRRLIDEYLKNHPEIEAVGEYVDDGVSGVVFDRPSFNAMMAFIQEGGANCILTKDLSRLGRDRIETGRYLRRIFPAYGVRFIAITDNIDTLNDSTDGLFISVKSIINDEYCRDISIKTRSALNVKRANGDYTGACPVYGYKKDESDRNKLAIDDYAAEIVRDIFRMKIDGYSSARIAATLNGRGVLSPMEYRKDRGLPYPKGGYADRDGASWCVTTIIRILNDETYTGTLVQGKYGTPTYKLRELVQKPEDEWHRTENAHEAIIMRHNFDLARKIMRLDTRTAPKGDKVYLFSGILICGSCGNRMTRKTVPYKGEKYHYYWCPTGKKNGCLTPAMLKERDLIDCVIGNIKAHITNIASLETLIAGLDSTRIASELAGRLTEQIAENERRLEKIRGYKSGLYESMMNGNLSKDEYKSLKGAYSADSDTLAIANAKLRNEIESVLSCRHERMAWTGHFTKFENLDSIDRRTVIQLIHSIRVLGKSEIEISFNYQLEYDSAVELFHKEAA
ncbi:MAG: recombinase family protein [Defluviitaleaceae bacterium]|nr:recombinase family protein [Defluviitaleaceae bacterium]